MGYNAHTTIGLPVYNEGKHLENTLKSIDSQADYIIICDNASTDSTEEICRNFVSDNKNARYIRLKENRGASVSFKLCAELAKTEYFMWVGGHDLLVPNYVTNLKMILDNNIDIILAYSNALHLDKEYHYRGFYYYDWSNLLYNDSPEIRVAAIVQLLLQDCTMFHGLYRKKIIDDYFAKFHRLISNDIFFIDHVILAYVALHGKMALSPFCNYIRIDPREKASKDENWKRVIIASDPNLPVDPRLVPMAVFKGQKAILDKLDGMPNVSKDVLKSAYQALLQIWGKYIS